MRAQFLCHVDKDTLFPNSRFLKFSSVRHDSNMYHAMKLSVEILDHIFSFLRVSHQGTLVACSKDPVLSLIVKRHLYYHIIVDTDGMPYSKCQANYTFEPDRLARLVSEEPHILHYVRILQIQGSKPHRLDKFASTLRMFPVLECIMLNAPTYVSGVYLPGIFRDALEDRVCLPTLTEVHLSGWVEFPFSLLDKGKNLKTLFLSGYFKIPISEGEFCSSSALPQLKTLRLCTAYIHPWVESHINELESLKCRLSTVEGLSKLLRACSETLSTLDLDLDGSSWPYSSNLFIPTGSILPARSLSELSLLSINLHQFTIRTFAKLIYMDQKPICLISGLPPAAETINIFLSSIRHLVVDFEIRIATLSDLVVVDFSPITQALETASLSIPKIDLYVYTGISTSALTHAQLLDSLDYDDMAKLVQKGVLVIHCEETAPECV